METNATPLAALRSTQVGIEELSLALPFTRSELSPERPEPYEGRADAYKQADMLEEARLDRLKTEELKAKVKNAPANEN